MSTEKVTLRREQAAAYGEPFLEPPPRLRGQSTYLALLSSLATDLDIMLNDLRSTQRNSNLISPSARIQNSSGQQRHGIDGMSLLTTTALNSTSHTASTSSTGYLTSALHSNNRTPLQQRKYDVRIIPAATTTTTIANNQTSNATTSSCHNSSPHYRRSVSATRRIYNHSSNRCSLQNSTQEQKTQKLQQEHQYRVNQDANNMRARHTKTDGGSPKYNNNSKRKSNHARNAQSTGNSHKAANQFECKRTLESSSTMTSDSETSLKAIRKMATTSISCTASTTSTSATSLRGLSTEVRNIQRLPLWSYQQKLLSQQQQQQKQQQKQQQQLLKEKKQEQNTELPVTLLQQQVASNAIAMQLLNCEEKMTRLTTELEKPATKTKETESSIDVPHGRQFSRNDSYRSSLSTATVTTKATKKIPSTIAMINFFENRSDNVGTYNKPSCNWLRKPSTVKPIRSSDPSGTQHMTSKQQAKTLNQLKSVNATTSTTTTKATEATSSSSNNNNSKNNNNDDKSCNSQQRLPFCGLDSIKGSDNNGGDGIEGKGTSNLSFDFNLHSATTTSETTTPITTKSTTAIKGHNNKLETEQFHSLDANESICDGQFEDDMEALLPKCHRLSRDELSPSRTSLISTSDDGSLAAGETSSETSHCSENSPPCDLGLVERLLLTHPVWFLPGIQRSGAVHFLQGKEEGNFIVRGSSQPNTMAVSVRLPPDTGPYIEHYLIQSNEGILSLESSRFKFDSIPALIAHYAQCCDELPVQLILPRALREAKNRQQLSSLALLGQEFWRYPMSCPKPTEVNARSPNSFTETSGLGTTVFSSSGNSSANCVQTASKILSPTNNIALGGPAGMFSEVGTPSDTNSSMSSFTTSGGQHMQLMSPESVDSVILTMSPVDGINPRNGLISELANHTANNLTTFKSNGLVSFKANNNNTKQVMENSIRSQRPKPPNTLNLDLRKPPVPPLRWSKPVSPHSPLATVERGLNAANNFTVTTTVTFSVDNKNSPQFVEVTTPASNTHPLTAANNSNSTFQTFAKRLSPEGECKDTLSSQGSSNGSRWQSHSSKDSHNSQHKIKTPNSSDTATTAISGNAGGGSSGKSRKSKARKESKHYQESDILDSPQIYCRSTLTDKISDYEDLWSIDHPNERAGLLSSFKPAEGVQGERPDLLQETPKIISLNANPLSPVISIQTPDSQPQGKEDASQTTPQPETSADTQQLIQFSGEAQPRSRVGLLLPGLISHSLSEDQLRSETIEGDTTPTAATPMASRSKQGSPFYAEPADALRQANILRRSQRGPILPSNHRHSEPPKASVVRSHMCPLLMSADIEKIAGSLDELKKQKQLKQPSQQQSQPQQQSSKRACGRLEQWQLDSSWEFMGKNDDADADEDNDNNYGHKYGDYDSEDHWKALSKTSQDKENYLDREPTNSNKQKPITVHQIIAKRLPDLNLPELVRCSTPQQQQQQQQHQHQNGIKYHQNELDGSHKSFDSQNMCRLSSYDNVERNFTLLHSYFNGDSAHSDDGTVFSEPWDSSQWDTLMPLDDTTITSETIHLSKCRPAVSEDDTIIEEIISTKENDQDTLKNKKSHSRQKVATILRNPSIRDREILCHPRNKISPYSSSAGPGETIRAYTLQLAEDNSSTFARNIENFISCTKESREAAPQVVMRNMRQFMNGMKNYLVKHGEGKFLQEVETARERLKSDEFLNLDAILETVMHQLVVLPLREHLYGMFVDYYTRSEDIQLLAENVKYACGRSACDFGIRPTVTPPSTSSLHVISNLLLRLQEAELPLDKLDLFLCVISTVFDATGCPRGQQLGADDFLPVLVYVVAKCGFVGAEIEAEFMWGLLQPTLLNGEPGYYLTALCSAVHVLKSFMASEKENGTSSLDWRSSSMPASSSVLRVIIPDECNGSLQTRTLPVRPHTTTREVCRIIAHKARITNPQDYALFKLVDGEETILTDNECPQDIRLAAKGKHCMLAYKRIDAKIAWPTATQPVLN